MQKVLKSHFYRLAHITEDISKVPRQNIPNELEVERIIIELWTKNITKASELLTISRRGVL